MTESNIKLRDRIVSGVLALLIPILGLNIGGSFNMAEATSYNDVTQNNISSAQDNEDKTQEAKFIVQATAGEGSNIVVMPNTVFKYRLYFDEEKKNPISDEKTAYSGSDGKMTLDLNNDNTVYVEIVSAHSHGYFLKEPKLYAVSAKGDSVNISLTRQARRYYSVSLKTINQGGSDEDAIDSSKANANKIKVVPYIMNENGERVEEKDNNKVTIMQYNSTHKKYIALLFQDEVYDFIYTSDEYQSQTITTKSLNPNDIKSAQTSLTGLTDTINGKEAYEMEPIIVEKLIDDKSLYFTDTLNAGKDKAISTLDITYGDSLNIYVKSDDSDHEILKNMTVKSSNESVVSAIKDNSSIKLKAEFSGNATINVTVPSDGKYKKSELSLKVNVKPKDLSDKVTILGIPKNPTVDSKSKLEVSIPSSEVVGDVKVTYSILNVTRLDGSDIKGPYDTYVKIDSDGTFTFLKACKFEVKVNVEVKTEDNKNITFSPITTGIITVNKSILNSKFENENISIKYGENAKNELNDFSSEYGELTYSSSNSDIVSVDKDGNITGNDIGKATITATLDSESYTFGYVDGKEINEISYSVEVEQADQNISFSDKMIKSITYGEEIEINTDWFEGIKENVEPIAEIEENDYVKLDENKIIVKKAGDNAQFKIRFNFAETKHYNKFTTPYFTVDVKRADRNIDIVAGSDKITGNTLGLDYGKQKQYQLSYVFSKEEAVDVNVSFNIYKLRNGVYEEITGEGQTSIDNTGLIKFADKDTGKYKITVKNEQGENYNESNAEAYINLELSKSDSLNCTYSQTDYNDWYNTTKGVTITPPEGYKISDDMSFDESNWKDEYVYTNNGKNQHIQFYVRNNQNGTIYKVEKENINIDNTNPYNLDISYKSEKNVYNTILNYITFGLVGSRDTNIEVTLSAYEDISGIESFSYELIPEDGRELNSKNAVNENVILDNVETAIDENGKTYYKASFKIEAEFRGDIKFTAKSRANIETKYDKNAKVIVDNKKPEIDIKLDSEAEVANGQYYNKSVVANISVSESNFDADKVDILINGQKLSESEYKLENEEWAKSGDTEKITWTNSIKFSKDGVYNISVIASDELGQTSDEKTTGFIIDETKPIISVEYFSDSPVVNEKFYTTKVRAKVLVNEVNFSADDIVFELKAQDVTLKNNISDYERILKELNDTLHNGEWISNGNNHYIEIEFNADANYSFTLNYTDLAGNDAEKKYSSPDFTIDQTPPTNLSAKYSEEKNFFEEIIDNITFNTYYYKDNVTITFSAEDMTSGIDSIDWVYQRQNGSSDSSVADVSKHFNKEDITFSEDGKTAEITVELSAEESKQYRGMISFTVTDMAGQKAYYPVENKDERITVVDNISPTRSVEYQKDNFVKAIDADSFKDATYDMKSDNNSYRLYYNDDATLKFTVKEANFFGEDIKLYDNGKPISFDEEWQQNGDEYTNTLTLSNEGEHIIKMTYTDRSTNEMNSYESNVIIIDRIKPIIDVQYSPKKTIQNIGGNNYYDEPQTATIKITEHNFRADDVAVTVTATDAGKNKINVTDYAAYLSSRDSWKKNGDTYTATIEYSVNANYTFDIAYSDLASHPADDYKQDKFTVDKYPPLTSKMKISYSKELNFWEKVLNGITFGYYAYQKNVTVTLTAVDDISGIESMKWTYTRENGASTTKNLKNDSGTIDRKNMTISSDGKTATAKFTLTADQSKQYRGKISFTATDRSGNTSGVKNDNDSILIVDTISPTRSVEFSKADRVVTASDMNDVSNYNYSTEGNSYKLYYKDSATATIKITEANFYPEDVNIAVNDSKQKVNNWKQNGDTWTGSLTLSKEGEYVITISYIDRSNNKMKTYTSNEIIVDHTNPVINIAYSPNKVVNTANGIKYYNSAQTATISVTERNFRADEIAAKISAVDVNGRAVGVEDYAQYLSKRSNWIKNGDVYTANIKYSADANYTFNIEYEDLAGRKLQNNIEDKFTVDKTAPKNLKISYSQNVFQNVLNSITFGYYNAPVTVTISAEDDTTAIEKFVYSYLKDNNSSNVNAQLLNEAISKADIKRSGSVNTATFKIPKSVLDAQHQYNGTVKFIAYDMSQNDSDKSDTKKIIVDNIRPEIDVTLNKPISTADGTAYYDGKIDATLKINEANFYSEDVRVMVYDINRERTLNPSVSWTDNSSDLHTGTFSIDKDGKYRIEVEYTDRSKNKMNNYTSDYLIIDTQKPSLKVTNIKNNTANKDKTYGFTIDASDTNIDSNSFKPVLEALMMTSSGQFTRESIDLSKYLRKNSSTSYSYVVDNLSDDAVYTLSCSVADMSGNKTEQILLDDGKTYDNVEFSINRNGSTFKIDENTQKLLDNYYVSSVDNDIVIQEINVDPIENYVVKLNGTALKENEGYTSSETTDTSKWCERKYVISSSLFENESDYDIKIESTDKAGSVAYSDLKGLEVKFVVDKTPPTLIVSGIEDNGRYQVQEQKVTVIPSDNGGKLGSLKIVILDSNGKEIKVLFNKSGEDLLKYLSSNNGKVEFNVPEGFENQVVFYCDDCSVGSNGQFNENKKVISNITVSPNNFVIFYANKPMFYSVTIGGSVLIISIIAAIVLIVRRKMRKRISQ